MPGRTPGTLPAPEAIESALDKLLRRFEHPREDVDAQRAQLTTAVRTVEKEIANLKAAIIAGADDAPASLVVELRRREDRLKTLVTELASVASEALTVTPEVENRIRDEAMALLKHWRELLLTTDQLPVTRALVRKLLGESRFVFYPQAEGQERWYELRVKPTLQKFFETVPSIGKTLASPTGFGRFTRELRRSLRDAA